MKVAALRGELWQDGGGRQVWREVLATRQVLERMLRLAQETEGARELNTLVEIYSMGAAGWCDC